MRPFYEVFDEMASCCIRAAELTWRTCFGGFDVPLSDPEDNVQLDFIYWGAINSLRQRLQMDDPFGHRVEPAWGYCLDQKSWERVPAQYWSCFSQPLPHRQRRYLLVVDLIRCVALQADRTWRLNSEYKRSYTPTVTDRRPDEGTSDAPHGGPRRGPTRPVTRADWFETLTKLAELTSDIRWETPRELQRAPLEMLQQVERAWGEWLLNAEFIYRNRNEDGSSVFNRRGEAEWRWMNLQPYVEPMNTALLRVHDTRLRQYVLTVALMLDTLLDWLTADIAMLAEQCQQASAAEYAALMHGREDDPVDPEILAVDYPQFQPSWYKGT